MLQQRLRRAARAGKALDEHLGVESELWKAPDEAMGGKLGCPVGRVKGDWKIMGGLVHLYVYISGGCIGVTTINPLILTFYKLPGTSKYLVSRCGEGRHGFFDGIFSDPRVVERSRSLSNP